LAQLMLSTCHAKEILHALQGMFDAGHSRPGTTMGSEFKGNGG